MESALVSGVALVLLLGIILGALTVHRYQQVAHSAREGARWASVRAADYAKETSNPAATQETIRTNGVLANAAGLDPNALRVTVTWSNNNDNRPYRTAVVDGRVKRVSNTVSVRVEYDWDPGFIFPRMTLSSTSVTILQY